VIVIDSSALCAILFLEPEAQKFADAIQAAGSPKFSAANLVETSIVIQSRKGDTGIREFDHQLVRGRIEIVPVDSAQAHIARDAFRLYGKGRHPAGLNFGDCFTYALAKITGFPVLAKGPEFARTDIEVVAL
jgi:ribonuclease VapC